MVFRVIDGGGKPKSFHKHKDQQITCHVCQEETGVDTSLVFKAIQSPMRPSGKGTPVHLCAYCISRGKITVLL